MQMKCGLKDFDQPEKGFSPMVCPIFFIMDAPGGSVGHKNVQVAPEADFVHEQARNQFHDQQPHLLLSVLIIAHVIADTSLDS